MKYYGIKRRERMEIFRYKYSKALAYLKYVVFSNDDKEKELYEDLYINKLGFYKNSDNSLPVSNFYYLNSMSTCDLIRRDQINQLKKGLKYLLKNQRSKRYYNSFQEGITELNKRLENMDSSLSMWYNKINLGFFEVKGERIANLIDRYSIVVHNVNTAYIGIEFTVYLTEKANGELESIIQNDYKHECGYAVESCYGYKHKIIDKLFKSYNVIHYNDNHLKSDQIYEFISCIEWELYNSLNNIFPFVLHNKGIMPPRIELFYTDLDFLNDKAKNFFDSVGVNSFCIQYIDEKQAMFFNPQLSGRYSNCDVSNRLIYLVQDDGIKQGNLESVKDMVSIHMNDYALEYYRILFLDLLLIDAGKIVVNYKKLLDKIKLKRNSLNSLFKLKYKFSVEMDLYNRYVREDDHNTNLRDLKKIYDDSYESMYKDNAKRYKFYNNLFEGVFIANKKFQTDISVILKEFDEKETILQNLYNYKNTSRGMKINELMLIITAVTLILVIYPSGAQVIADIIDNGLRMLENVFNLSK